MSGYSTIAQVLSLVRNAKFGEMVRHLEGLIESEIWRDFTTPVGTHFEFRRCEFDFFLASQDTDPTTIRHAYIQAKDVEDLASKRFHLADITGRGTKPDEGDRRTWADVAALYDLDPSGASVRIAEWGRRGFAVVTSDTSTIARQPQHREAVERGAPTRPQERRWRVSWSDDRPAAQVIVEKLAADPELERAVLNLLRAKGMRDTRSDEKRRSDACDDQPRYNGSDHE